MSNENVTDTFFQCGKKIAEEQDTVSLGYK